MSALSVERLWVRYSNGVQALRDVSLSVNSGQVLGVIGESGSGKSTLIRAWLSLMAVESGTVRWNGDEVNSLSPLQLRERRAFVQAVFQDSVLSLDPLFTVERCLSEPFAVRRQAVNLKILESLLEQVQLPIHVLSRLPRELSAGERQRIAIARALALGPSCLLLDEPVSSLDVSIQGQILELIQALQRTRGLTLVIVSHDLHVVRYLANEVAVLFAGRVVERGPAQAVLSTPRHPYTRSLLVGEGPASAEIAAEPGCVYRRRCPLAAPVCSQTPPPLVGTHAVSCFMVK